MTRTVCGRCEMDKCQCKTIRATAMTTLREAAQQALEALEYYRSGEDYQPTPASEAITALRAALADPVKTEIRDSGEG